MPYSTGLVTTHDADQTWQPLDSPCENAPVDDLTVASEQRRPIGFDRGTVLASADRSHTWKPVMDISTTNPPDASGWRILFIDRQHGWTSLGN